MRQTETNKKIEKLNLKNLKNNKKKIKTCARVSRPEGAFFFFENYLKKKKLYARYSPASGGGRNGTALFRDLRFATWANAHTTHAYPW